MNHMKERRYFLILNVLFLLFFSLLALQIQISQAQDNEPIEPSEPSNVYIEEKAVYDAPIGDDRPIVHLSGILYWERLSGTALYFFINKTDIISYRIWDHDTGEEFNYDDQCLQSFDFGCYSLEADKFIIRAERRSFEYTIDAYYDPDIIQDTNMIVIFNSQSVDFSMDVDDETVYARVDYRNEITLPRGAGIVSLAPIDEGLLDLIKVEDDRYQMVWEYKNRQMDSKHDPLMIEVTYSFDPIYLAFTEQIYQQQQIQKERQEEEQRLDLLNASFIIIATLAIVASIISILFAYLLARRRYEPKLQQARELPRRAVTDIESSQSLKVPVKSLFLGIMIIIPLLFTPTPTYAQTVETDTIQQHTVMDLGKEPFELTETTTLTLPVLREYIYVYVNTSAVIEFDARDAQGNKLTWLKEENRYKINNPGYSFTYEITRPYIVYDYNQILVYMDRIWSEFILPQEFMTADDFYFNVDLYYSVILPEGAYLYSASPSDLMIFGKTNTGRYNVTFVDKDRRMDAFHDVFETQVTFSFVDILEALENLNVDFQKDKVVVQQTEELIDVARNEILLFSILGLIAPILSFLIAYWVFRRRYQKLIERMEKQQEENIFVESQQINALTASLEQSDGDLVKSYIGQYWRVIRKLSKLMNRDISFYTNSRILTELKKREIAVDEPLLVDVLTRGQEITEEDEIGYEQLYEYAQQVDLLLEEFDNL
ncbi:MAG: hypothetical protein INQ03_08640 [Candidatus Heimdallarchaeota archaeon]|nr:hypothetical protein [Candidatus Heimdallarchaeota archaeon]